jgi:hypothetical protein
MTMRRWLAVPLVLGAGLAAAALPAGSALADTTIGQTGTTVPSHYWVFDDEYINPAAVVPADGIITSFQTQSAASGESTCHFAGVYDFQVLRPEGNNQYLVVGDTGDQTDPCDGQLLSYPVNIPVQAGDLLGVYVKWLWAGVLSSGSYDVTHQNFGEPKVGQTITVNTDYTGLGIDESATLETPADLLASLDTAAQQAGGPGNSLPDKVQQAQSDLQAGDVTGTCSVLTAFINEVNAQTGKSIPADTAGQLTTAAGQVQTLLSCGS